MGFLAWFTHVALLVVNIHEVVKMNIGQCDRLAAECCQQIFENPLISVKKKVSIIFNFEMDGLLIMSISFSNVCIQEGFSKEIVKKNYNILPFFWLQNL